MEREREKERKREISQKTYKSPVGTWENVEASLIIKEMLFKVTMRYYLTPVRLPFIRMMKDKCWWGHEEREILVHYLWKCKLAQPLVKLYGSFLKKLKIQQPYGLSIPLLGLCQKEINILKECLHSHGDWSIIQSR
jgi:hypothetical protein